MYMINLSIFQSLLNSLQMIFKDRQHSNFQKHPHISIRWYVHSLVYPSIGPSFRYTFFFFAKTRGNGQNSSHLLQYFSFNLSLSICPLAGLLILCNKSGLEKWNQGRIAAINTIFLGSDWIWKNQCSMLFNGRSPNTRSNKSKIAGMNITQILYGLIAYF